MILELKSWQPGAFIFDTKVIAGVARTDYAPAQTRFGAAAVQWTDAAILKAAFSSLVDMASKKGRA